MITKDQFLSETLEQWKAAGKFDWRFRVNEPDVQYLIFRALNERAALIMARPSIIHCDDETLASLTLEVYRVARPFDVDNEAAIVYPTTASEALLYSYSPINKFGGPRFTADLEVAHVLDDFRREVRNVLAGKRQSIWLQGSDTFGLPKVEDVVTMIKTGNTSNNVIRLLDRFPDSKEARSALWLLTATLEAGTAVTAMSVLKGWGEAIDVSSMFRIASDLSNRPAASSASRMLAHEVARGNASALDALFVLSRDQKWLAQIDPPWAGQPLENSEALYDAVCRQYPKRSKS